MFALTQMVVEGSWTAGLFIKAKSLLIKDCQARRTFSTEKFQKYGCAQRKKKPEGSTVTTRVPLVDDSAVREELRVIFTLQKSLENFSKTLFLAHKQKERGPFKIFFQEWKLGLDCRKLLKLHILECLVSGLEGLSHSRPWNSTNFVICYMKRGLRCRQKSKRSWSSLTVIMTSCGQKKITQVL